MPLIVTAQIVDDHASQRAHRKTIGRTSTLRVSHEPHDVRVENLSSTGCLLTSGMRLPIGTKIRLGLAGSGVVEGEIVREEGGQYGCRFSDTLTQAQIQASFGTDALVVGPFAAAMDVDDRIAVDAEKWPRPFRGAILIGLGLLSWLAVTISVLVLRR